MGDGERSAAEREAARLERERRRAAPPDSRYGAPAEPPYEASPEPPYEASPEPPYESSPEPPYEPGPGAEYEPLPGPADDEADEVPLGVRRVSRADRASASRPPRRAAGRDRARRPPPRSRPVRSRPARSPRAAAAPRGVRAWIARLTVLLVLGLIAAAVWFGIELYQPFGTSPHGRVTVVVPAHTGAQQIGDMLAREGIIPSGFFFNLRAKLAGDRGKLLPGTYHLEKDMTYAAVLKALMTPPPPVPTQEITMIPGERRITFAVRLRAIGVKGDYYADTRHSRLLDPTAYGAPRSTPSLEGFLFPDTYQLRSPVRLSDLIAAQLKRFKQVFATVDMSYARAHHLTPYDVLIIASLIQAEAFSSHDMPLVASVIYNRLHDHILLGFDSTTRYATGNFTKPLTQSELASSSPWNTRNHAGLPPTPIDSPDLQTIEAAAHPPSTNYLYFVSRPCSTALAFSSSYDQFLQDVAAFDATQSQNGQPPLKRCKR